MRIEELWLRNYGCYRDVLVQFPSGVVGIVGPNGRGKSTLVEGAAWVLFGQQAGARTTKEGIRNSLAPRGEPVEGRVVFVHEGARYTVLRALKGKGLVPDASVSGDEGLLATGNAPTTDEVARIVGMDFVSFETSVFTRQKELAAISALRPADRRERLLRILRIDRIDDAVDACRTAVRGAASALESLRASSTRPADAVECEMAGVRKRREDAEAAVRGSVERERMARAALAALEEAGAALSAREREYAQLKESVALMDKSIATLLERKSLEEARAREVEAARKEAGEFSDAAEKVATLERAVRELEAGKRKSDERAMLEKELCRRRASRERNLQDAEALKHDTKADAAVKKAEKALEAAKAALADANSRAAVARERLDALSEESEKIRRHLDTVKSLGRDAECPTCGRRLGEHHGKLLGDMGERLSEAGERERNLKAELKALAREEGELVKSRDAAARELTLARDAARKEAVKLERKKGIASRVKELEKEMDELEKAIEKLGAPVDYDGLEEAVKALASERRREVRLAAALRTLAGLERSGKGREDVARKLAAMEGKRDEAAKMIKERGDPAPERERHLAAVSEARVEVERALGARSVANADIGHCREREATLAVELAAAQKRSTDQARLEAEVTQLAAAEGLLAGFRDHMAGTVRPRLSALASEILGRMSGGRYPEAALDEDYELTLLSDGGMHPLRRFSGGEQDMANLALRLAVSEMVAETFGRGGLGMVVLDEVFSSLDADHLRETLATLGALSGMFEQVIVVTHQEAVRDGMSHVIVVDDGGVRLE